MSEPSLFETPAEFRAACDQARARGARVALVPTMGALHHGHLALVREARRAAEEATAARPFVAVSVFVNPTQFGPHEDFSRYPRDLEGDTRKLASVGADAVFAPSAPRAMYPEGEETRVRVGPLASHLCGPFRPGHFEGVATVVAKLFALAGPSLAVFGRKDYQQLAILRRVAIDLFFPVQIVGYPIVRERDGLAMSSRNAYLSPEERLRARALSRGLSRAWDAFETGERDAARLEQLARAEVTSATPDIDYVSVADPHSLAPFPAGGRVPAAALVAIACRLGKTRLLDNVVLGEDPRPSPHADDGPAPIV